MFYKLHEKLLLRGWTEKIEKTMRQVNPECKCRGLLI